MWSAKKLGLRAIQSALSDRGSVTLLVAFSLVVMLGIAGLAIDLGYMYLQKNRMQAVADAAAR